MKSKDPRILIAGSGPTGLTAAVELARRGIAVRIIDSKQGPTPLSKAVGISARSLDILEPSGVTERLLAAGIRIRRGHVHHEGRVLGVIDFTALPHRFNFLLSLPQSDTETILADVLAKLGISVEWCAKLTRLEQRGDEAEVSIDTVDGPQTARYDYVFGADGAQSTVREAMRLAFEGHTHSRQWSIADAEIHDWPYEPGDVHLFLHAGGDVGFIIPIGMHRFRAVSNTEDALARVPGPYRIAKLLRTDVFRIHARQASEYQVGSVFLGGDAAHVHSPVGARGMNLGIEDAASFARRFATGDLGGYTSERKPVGRRWIDLSERVLALAQSTGLKAAARNAAFRVIGRLPALQRPGLERIAGLKE